MATVEHCLYCFETLSANLEQRTPMSLSEVEASWAAYPKGLESEELEEEEEEETSTSEPEDASQAKRPKARNLLLQRLTGRKSDSSGISTPSDSSSSLEPSTTATTPGSSTNSFTPVGVGRHTSQRSSVISEIPLFITWNTVSKTSNQRFLRGCIGTFEEQPLATGLSSYALTSALHDHRFSPVTLNELSSLEVAVTLLTDFETAKDPLDWELGVHGIKISFYARNRRFGACYLPDVAVEQGWDKEETVVSAMRKAGWGGRKEKWRDVGDFKVTRFQGMAESVGYDEFQKWREWVASGEKK
ncbi:hypothetical protein B7494_g6142 [Chlorociboria aeruginascens]|nr:hypothetical protein B7494_g6142 [Chlorociboria aeruginascens]